MTEQSSSQPSTQAQTASAGMHPVLERLRGGLIASAQAYPGEPMRDPRTMDQVAQACVAGGAVGIRAQGLADLALTTASSSPRPSPTPSPWPPPEARSWHWTAPGAPAPTG